MKSTAILFWLTALCVGLFIVVLTLTASSDFNQDLGRHLKLGSIILNTHTVPTTNLFSYTNPAYPFINHHWLSQVIFYLVHKLSGMDGLIVLKVLLILSSFTILYFFTSTKSSYVTAAAAIVIVSPLLLERSDVRPEVFGYLYFSCIVWIFGIYHRKREILWILPFILLIWSNTHISFLFGELLSAGILIDIWRQAFVKRNNNYSKPYTILLPLIMFVSLILNPHGVYGAIYPFFIFQNYGYQIVENQNIFFLLSYTHNILMYYFLCTLIVSIPSAVILIYKRTYRFGCYMLLFSLLSLWQIRHLPFYILMAVPSIGIALQYVLRSIPRHYRNKSLASFGIIMIAVFMSVVLASGIYARTYDQQDYVGLSYHEDGKRAADFLLTHKLPGNIFNNFDIGGYAIYRLYPQYKVFVDNRPEAYPKTFFDNEYIALQNDPEKRKQIFKHYNIQTVFFAHTDQTPWAMEFSTSILMDKEWKLVYLDSAMMVLTKGTNLADIRTDEHMEAALISKEDDYVGLIRLANIFMALDKTTSANKAFAKAILRNPDSCLIRKILYKQQQQGRYIMEGGVVSDPWYCP